MGITLKKEILLWSGLMQNEKYSQSLVSGAALLSLEPKLKRPKLTVKEADALEKILSKTTLSDTGCWEWGGYINPQGYGSFYFEKKSWPTHRIAYRFLVQVPKRSLVIDHLCRNRKCLNPHHLEQVTTRENILRGVGWTAVQARKTECNLGHPFTPENTRIRRTGSRRCLECQRNFHRKWLKKKLASLESK